MPRKPASETTRLVPPPMTVKASPAWRAIASAAVKAGMVAASTSQSASPPIPNRV
jgi:hypothetical protein